MNESMNQAPVFRSSKAFSLKYELNKIKHIGQLYVPKLPENYFNGFIICFSSLYSITLFVALISYFAEKYRFAFSILVFYCFYIFRSFINVLQYFLWNGFFLKALKHFIVQNIFAISRILWSSPSWNALATNEPLSSLGIPKANR
jgi:hypothetical protein